MSARIVRAPRAFLCLVRWDWAREMKRKETLVSMLVFASITLVVFAFAIPPESETGVRARAGVLWVTLLLAGSIGVDRAFRGTDAERLLEGVLVAPVGRVTFFYARVVSTFLLVGLLGIVVLGAFCLLYTVPLDAARAARVVAVVLGGLFGMVTAGVSVSALTRGVRGSEVLLRILLFPLLIPLFRAAVRATDQAFAGQSIDPLAIVMLGAFAVIYLCLGQLLIEPMLADPDG